MRQKRWPAISFMTLVFLVECMVVQSRKRKPETYWPSLFYMVLQSSPFVPVSTAQPQMPLLTPSRVRSFHAGAKIRALLNFSVVCGLLASESWVVWKEKLCA
jgi:hypothetical protein